MTPINFNGLDTNVHGPIRLGILTALQMDGALDFTTLKKTPGGGGWQFESPFAQIGGKRLRGQKKAFVGLRPKTTYRMTPGGKKA